MFFAVASIALALRLHDPHFVNESLWYEDGYIFINQSYELGIASLFTPFAGSPFLFHRIVALVATVGPLTATPYLFFIAWALSFYLVIWVVITRGSALGLNDLTILVIVASISLQPSQGEPWFNMNSANFSIATALSLYVCMPIKRNISRVEIIALAVCCLSTQCTLILAAILLVQLAVLRDFSSRGPTYIVFIVCAVAQIFAIRVSHRLDGIAVDVSPADWFRVVSNFIFFGNMNSFVRTLAGLFWVGLLLQLLKLATGRGVPLDRTLLRSVLFALFTAFSVFVIEAMSAGIFFPAISPIDMCSRYFLVPYSLLFFVAFSCTKDNSYAQAAMILIVGSICVATFQTVDRQDRDSTTGLLTHSNMQWEAYARWQQFQPSLVIPINANLPVYPPVASVYLGRAKYGRRANVEEISLDPTGAVKPLSLGEERTLSFDISEHCSHDRYVALQFDVWRSRMGWARVHWGSADSTAVGGLLDRFYPAGIVQMQFAFQREITDSIINFQPTMGVPQARVLSTLELFKESTSRQAMTIGKPTRPGGEFKLRSAKLICLG